MSEQPIAICDRCLSDPFHLGYTVTTVKGKPFNKRDFPTCIICGKQAGRMAYIKNVNGGRFHLATIH